MSFSAQAGPVLYFPVPGTGDRANLASPGTVIGPIVLGFIAHHTGLRPTLPYRIP
jgi:hypothetical protein